MDMENAKIKEMLRKNKLMVKSSGKWEINGENY